MTAMQNAPAAQTASNKTSMMKKPMGISESTAQIKSHAVALRVHRPVSASRNSVYRHPGRYRLRGIGRFGNH